MSLEGLISGSLATNDVATSAVDADGQKHGGGTPELLGTALHAVFCGAVWSYGELASARS